MLPLRYLWKETKGVTLLGDVAHLMTPFAREGMNLAMSDAWSLATGNIFKSQRGAGKLTQCY